MKYQNSIKYKKNEILQAWLYLAPFLLVFSVFLAIPFFYSIYLSVHKVPMPIRDAANVFSTMEFVGLGNFKLVLSDINFWWSMLVAIMYMSITIPVGIFFSLALAVILNNKLKGVYFFRSAFFLPFVLDMLVIGIIWKLLYSNDGIFSTVLSKIGITYFQDTGFLGNPKTALISIAFTVIIKGLGFGMVLFLTALSNISPNIYEAADIDGLSWTQKFRHITLPLVKPTTLFLVVAGIIGALNAFTEFFALTSGGPATMLGGEPISATKITGYYIFQKFQQQRYGYSAAMSYFLLAFALIVSWVNYKFLRAKS